MLEATPLHKIWWRLPFAKQLVWSQPACPLAQLLSLRRGNIPHYDIWWTLEDGGNVDGRESWNMAEADYRP